MQALTPSGKSRFDLAREKLDAALAVENSGSETSVYVTAPQPRRVAPPFSTLTEARLALSRIKPSDAPNDQTTLENFLSNLASETRVAKVIFAGASALAAPVPARIHPIAVGDAVAKRRDWLVHAEARSPWRGGASRESDDRELQPANAHSATGRDRRRQGSRARQGSARRRARPRRLEFPAIPFRAHL